MANQIHVLQNGIWEVAHQMYVNINGVWNPVVKGYVNISGSWEVMHDPFFLTFHPLVQAHYLSVETVDRANIGRYIIINDVIEGWNTNGVLAELDSLHIAINSRKAMDTCFITGLVTDSVAAASIDAGGNWVLDGATEVLFDPVTAQTATNLSRWKNSLFTVISLDFKGVGYPRLIAQIDGPSVTKLDETGDTHDRVRWTPNKNDTFITSIELPEPPDNVFVSIAGVIDTAAATSDLRIGSSSISGGAISYGQDFDGPIRIQSFEYNDMIIRVWGFGGAPDADDLIYGMNLLK